MAKLIKIAGAKEVPPGQAAAFTVEGQRIALFNVEGTYYAIGDSCTHRGGPLSEWDVQGTKVICPWHGADFDLKTGAVMRAARPPGSSELSGRDRWQRCANRDLAHPLDNEEDHPSPVNFARDSKVSRQVNSP